MAGKKKGVIIGSSIGAAALLGVWIIFGSRIGYMVGGYAFENGKYKIAVAGYKLAGDYLDAGEKLVVAQQALDYYEGEKAFEKGDYQLAYDEFTASNGYNDAYTRASEAQKGLNYVNGVADYEAGDYVAAVQCFKDAYNFSDAAERLPDAYFQAAISLMASGDYVSAGEYYDLSEMDTGSDGIFACGSALMNAGDYENAGYVFGLSDDADCQNYSNYCTGRDKLEKGDLYVAVTYFGNSGGVEDSDELYIETSYDAGLLSIETGDYVRGRTEFSRVGDYEDAEYYLSVCDFLEAEDCYTQGKLNTAQSLYESLPEDFEYDGVTVSERLSELDSYSSFVAICGTWDFVEGVMESRRDYSYYYERWTYDLDHSDADLQIYCVINDDGSVDVSFDLHYKIYSNFASLAALLEYENVWYCETIHCDSYSSTIALDDYSSISFSGGNATVEYSRTITPATYYSETMSTTVTFGDVFQE